MAAPEDGPVSALDARIERTVEMVRSVWAFALCLTIFGVIFWGEAWWLLIVVPLMFVGYALSLLACGFFIAHTTTPEEIAELKAGMQAEAVHNFKELSTEQLDPENSDHAAAAEAAGVSLGTVVEISQKNIARYMDHDIPEWIDIKMKGETHRYFFDSVAMRAPDGGFALPDEEGVTLFRAALFKRGQPAQSE